MLKCMPGDFSKPSGCLNSYSPTMAWYISLQYETGGMNVSPGIADIVLPVSFRYSWRKKPAIVVHLASECR